jgi:hypothetical protein
MNKVFLLTYGKENEDINKTMRTYNRLISNSNNLNNLKQIK